MKIYLFLLIQLFSLSSFAAETSNVDIKVYRDPDCQCCHKWISHLEENKFNVLDAVTMIGVGIALFFTFANPFVGQLAG